MNPHARCPPEGRLRAHSLPPEGAGRERPGKAGSAAPSNFALVRLSGSAGNVSGMRLSLPGLRT